MKRYESKLHINRKMWVSRLTVMSMTVSKATSIKIKIDIVRKLKKMKSYTSYQISFVFSLL